MTMTTRPITRPPTNNNGTQQKKPRNRLWKYGVILTAGVIALISLKECERCDQLNKPCVPAKTRPIKPKPEPIRKAAPTPKPRPKAFVPVPPRPKVRPKPQPKPRPKPKPEIPKATEAETKAFKKALLADFDRLIKGPQTSYGGESVKVRLSVTVKGQKRTFRYKLYGNADAKEEFTPGVLSEVKRTICDPQRHVRFKGKSFDFTVSSIKYNLGG